MFIAGLLMGALMRLPGGSPPEILAGSLPVMVAAGLVIISILPFGFFASLGRGYLLPIALAILILMAANLSMIVGRGEVFPWAVPGLYITEQDAIPLASYAILALTSLAGVLATYLWWKYADQPR
jgi:ABC-2 type transport system permease protein